MAENRFIAELASRRRAQLQRYLRRHVRNADDIPDILQEVFLRLLRVPDHETIRAPEAYMFTVARHVAQQHALRLGATAGQGESESLLGGPGLINETDPSLELSGEECLQAIERALELLSPKAQAAFVLSRRDGLSIEEISVRMGISRFMAKKYIVKALVHIRDHLKDV